MSTKDVVDRFRWPRRRTRLPGRRRLRELAQEPRLALRALTRGRTSTGRPGDRRLIGLLMVRDEDDILEAMLTSATRWFDRILVLDGTEPGPGRDRTDAILDRFPEVVFRLRDEALGHPVRDGARQHLLAEARRRYGVGHWVGILHADEFLDQDPRPMLAAHHPGRDPSIRVRLVHTFLHTDDRADWETKATRPLRDRVNHLMWPGVPEARFFFDSGDRDYDPMHHGKVIPTSFRNGPLVDGYVVVQYNERDPAQLLDRARDRAATRWQRAHYRRLDDGIAAAFTDTLDLPDAPFAPEFAGDPEGPFVPRHRSTVPVGPLPPPPPVIEQTAANPAVTFAPGLAALVRDPTRIGALRWATTVRSDRPGVAALVRHTARVVGSRRTSEAQRHRTAMEFVLLLPGLTDPSPVRSIRADPSQAAALREILAP